MLINYFKRVIIIYNIYICTFLIGVIMDIKHLMAHKSMGNYDLKCKLIEKTPSIGDFKTAFTLAEVLITLGIIGIVAAMTMPTLINKTQDKVLETQRKKAENSLANGYKSILAMNEVFKIDETTMFSPDCINNIPDCFSKENKKAFKIIRDSSTAQGKDGIIATLPKEYGKSEMKWEDLFYIFQTTDGYTYGINLDKNEFENKNYTVNIYADVNSSKNPNTYGSDLVTYMLTQNGRISDSTNYGGEDPIKGCSVDNLDACKTEEACDALYFQISSDSGNGGPCPFVYWSWSGVCSRNDLYCN